MAGIPILSTLLILIPFCVCQDGNELKHEVLFQKFMEDMTTKQVELLSHFQDNVKTQLGEEIKNTINDMKGELMEDLQNTVNDMKAELKQDVQNKINELESERQPMDQCCLETRNDVATLQSLLDTDECATENHNCSKYAVCIDTKVSFRCKCKPGYEGDGYSCKDKNECATRKRCNEPAICINLPGSYTCGCRPGYKSEGFDMDGNLICEEEDECSEGTHECDDYAECKNTNGSYTCTCSIFYQGDGFRCQEISHPGCQYPFRFYRDIGCLYINEKLRPWDQSRSDCKEMGGDLFVAEEADQFLRLAEHFLESNFAKKARYMYVGVKNGVWLKGRTVANEEKSPGNPNMGSNYCGYTDGDSRDKFLLWASGCYNSRWAICEKDV